jgi:hypothetical protein
LLQQKRANAQNIYYLQKSQLKIKGLAHCITFVSSSSEGEELLNSDRVKSQWGGSERIKRGGSQKSKAKSNRSRERKKSQKSCT